MKAKQFIEAVVQKAEDGKITFVASDETLDRSGEVIPIETWDLTNFMRNPVMLVDHDYCVENIIGLAKNIRIEGKQLLFEPVFHEITELAKSVSQMVLEGVLNTVSVGFLPHGPIKDGDTGRNELLEISFVAVPANPSAERLKSLQKQVTEENKMQIKSWVEKQNEILDAIRIEVLKSKFDEPAAEVWVKEHNYKFVSKDESEKTFVFHLVNPDVKCEGEIKTIDIDEGVKLFACRIKERQSAEADKVLEELREFNRTLLADNIAMKEGRVLSGRNRKRIEEAVSILKQASEALDELLNATDPSAEKDTGESREPKADAIASKSAVKADSRVRRALKKINKDTNLLLRELSD